MIPDLLTELFSAVVALSWRAGWLIVVLVALRVAVRGRVPAQVWFAAWILVAIRLLLPFSVPTGWSPYNLSAAQPPAAASAPPARASIAIALAEPALAPTAQEISPPLTSVAPLDTATVSAPIAIVAPSWSWTEILAAIWIAGVASLALARLAGAWNFRRQLRDARPVGDGRVAAVVEDELQRAGGRARLALAETGAVDAPALYGLMRPRLLLPPGLIAKLTDGELRHVVRHELGHWRRRDLLAQELMQAAVALHWFNPLAWLAARLARADCELACDEFVLRREAPGGAPAYGATLLKVLGVVRGRRRPLAVVAMLEGREQLTQRIRMIAGYRASTAAGVLGGVALVAVLAVASLTRETHAEEKPGAAKPVATAAQAAPPAVAEERRSGAPVERPSVLFIRTEHGWNTAGTREAREQLLAELENGRGFGNAGVYILNPNGIVVSDEKARQLEFGQPNQAATRIRTEPPAAEAIKALKESLDEEKAAVSAATAVNDAKTMAEADQRAQTDRAAQAFAYLKAAADQQRQKVDQLARELQAYKEKNQMISVDQLRDIVNDTLKLLNAEVNRTAMVLTAAEIRRNQVLDRRAKRLDLTDLPFIAGQPLVSQLTQQLAAAKIAVEGLHQKYLEKHPMVVEATNNVAAIEKELLRAVESTCRQIEADFEVAQQSSARALQELERIKVKSLALDRDALEYTSKERELRTNEQILQNITARARETNDAMKSNPAAKGTVTIGIDKDGVVSFNGKNVTDDRLLELLKEVHNIDKNIPVLIKADETTSLKRLALVMDSCRKAALNKFSLQSHSDIVLVPALAQPPVERSVAISGQVKTPGLYPMGDGKISIVGLVLKAGGLTETGNGKKVRVSRVDPASKSAKIFFVNVEAMLRGEPETGTDAATWLLEPGDIVYVPERIL